jgi:EAL domain-containing protein (putative c-di-GMP-specific phosphodiesterase class I)/PAS domain-containing protein
LAENKDMTAQQPQHAPVRVLIAANSENEAHAFDSLLRDAGIATRTEVVDLSMALQSVTDADLVLANADLPNLQQLLPNLRATAPNVPIILINHEAAGLSTTAGLQMGAADVVPKSEPDRLVLVVKRELENVCQSQKLVDTRRALEEAEQRCQLLLNSSRAAISYVHEGMHIHANSGYLDLFGFEDSDELLGIPLIDLLDEASASALKSSMKKFRNDGEEAVLDFSGQGTQGGAVTGNMTLAAAEYEGEHCMQVTIRTARAAPSADLDMIPVLVEETPQTSNDNSVDFELVAEDEEETSTALASLADATSEAVEPTEPAEPAEAPAGQNSELLSISDFLAAANAADDSPACAIFAAEIDEFAVLQNDHGISGAAEIARQVAVHLGKAMGTRPMTQLSNYQYAFSIGGAHKDSIVTEVEDLSATFDNLMPEIGGKTVRPSVSFGGAILDRTQPGSAEASLNHAFSTLRTALDQGNSSCVVVRPTESEQQNEQSDEASQVLRLVNEAIENQKFVLLFQPIISLRGDSDEHYEVFMRMLDREGAQMAPNEFLRTAIDNGVAGKIDRWVILQSIKLLSTHRSKGHNTRLTINLTSNSVTDPEFIQWLGVAIKAARLPSDAVIFQITERDAASYVRQTREFMDGLKQMHCRASLSRFGLNDDPFELLNHIPADFVKLDGAQIESMGANAELRESISEMIRKLQAAGKLTIVPMVESATVLSALWQAGANYIQGHYLQEPSTQMDYDFSTDD